MTEQAYRKKLIEISLPLSAINKASINEKAIRHGHPSTLHLWWSRKPLAACRAVLFASLVDDPSEHPNEFPSEKDQEKERQRLFDIIEELVQKENAHNKDVLKNALDEICASVEMPIPPIRDPFCGGGSIPLEAQRLGLQARASDLNPVAVLITKALIEIPPKFAGRLPVAPDAQQKLMESSQRGAYGLAHDIRYYGEWMRDEAKKRIGHLYPTVTLPPEYGSGEATVIAWLWVRTVTCPNPACGVQMPLTSKWWLSKKERKMTWVEPVIDMKEQPPALHFLIKQGHTGTPQEGTVNRTGARCIVCHTSVPFPYIRNEGKSGRMRTQLMAIVAEGKRRRVYLAPDEIHVTCASEACPTWWPEANLPNNPRNFNTPIYGICTFSDLFTSRQLVALTTFSDLVQEVRQRVLCDAQQAHFSDDKTPLYKHGAGAVAYADAVATYLAIAVDRLADKGSSICAWDVTRDNLGHTFARQAIPMIWDFGEANPISNSGGNFFGAVKWVAEVIEASPCEQQGESCLEELELLETFVSPNSDEVYQRDATESINGIPRALVVTDPPYYDNIGYAELSDFFYIWLRRSLHDIYPDLFQTVLTPKKTELVANPARFGGSKEKARAFFEGHLSAIFRRMRAMQSEHYPMILYYAFKQTDTEVEGESTEGVYAMRSSTGWETMLESLIQAGFMITGTWPIRTEMLNRSGGQGTNSLASSIVLICRPRQEAPVATRRQFLVALRRELPSALKILQQHGDIAPVDLAQACVGPGMAVYSRYSQVLESDGSLLRVHTALQLINRTLDEILSEQDSEYDMETRWAIAWFEQYGMGTGTYGDADVLSKAKNTSVDALKKMGWLESGMGKVRLLNYVELSARWQPQQSRVLTVWEITQRMIYALNEQSEQNAADILRVTGAKGEMARDLAYRLHSICDRKEWSQEAQLYNDLVTSWSSMMRRAHDEHSGIEQERLFDE